MSDGPRAWVTMIGVAAIAVAPALACAQGVYRIVGADGRVTYSDQPPASISPNGRVDVLRAPKGMPALVPPGTPVTPYGPAAGGSPSGAGPSSAGAHPRSATKRASAEPRAPAVAGATQASGPQRATVDPAVEGAVIGVLGIEDIVRRTESICVSTLPTSARRYSGAVDDWARRNARTVVVARRVLASEFDVAQRELIEAGVRQRNAALFEKVVEAPAAMRIAWCDRSAAEMVGGRMDVHDKPKLAGPLAELPVR